MLWWTIQQLKAKDPKTRLKAIIKLGESEDPAVVDHAIPALNDPDKAVRVEAARILGKLKDERGATSLITALHDRESEVREAAAEALKEIGAKQAMEPLVAALKDDNTGVRWRAANALDSLGWSPSNDEQLVLQLVALGKLDKAANYGAIAIEPIVGTLRSGVYYKRMQAVEALSRIGDARVVKPLIAALRDDDNHVRVSAVEALSSVGDSRAVDPLVSTLRDKDNRVRATAIAALSRIGDSRAIEPLSKLLKDLSWDVRMAAIEALGKFKDPSVIKPLAECLKDKDADARLAAVDALGKLNAPESIEALVFTLTDEQERVRSCATAVLYKLNKTWEQSPGAKAAIPDLQKAAKSNNYWVRQAATEVLAKISGLAQAPKTQAPTSFADPVQWKKATAVDAIVASLGDVDRDLRQASAEALGRIGDPRSKEPLCAALEDNDEWVRLAAARSLEKLQWQPETPAQRARWLTILEKWDDLIALGEGALDGIVSLLRSKNSTTRKNAAETLGKIGNLKAAPALAECLKDNFPHVRSAAAKALAAMKWQATNDAMRAQIAVEIRDWETAVACGEAAVEPLVLAAKEKHESEEIWQQAEAALARITDPAAVKRLVGFAVDAEIGKSIATALRNILSTHAEQVSSEDLNAVSGVQTISQFHFELEPDSGTYAPVGMEEIDCSLFGEIARQVLERRTVPA